MKPKTISETYPTPIVVFNTNTRTPEWIEQNVDIPAQNELFQVIIRGRTSYSFEGDAAIDDLVLTPGTC